MIIKDVNLQEFLDYTKDKTVLCIGAGSFFRIACMDLGDKVKLNTVIDNNPVKWGSEITVADMVARVYAPHEASEKFQLNKCALLITAAAYSDVIDSLSRFSVYDDLEYFVYPLIKKKSLATLNEFMAASAEKLIPKIIHYCWFGKSDIPKHLQRYMESWRRFCPEYEIVRWDENTYDVTANPFLKKAYDVNMWAFVSDYARFEILYKYGGIYLDTDVEVIKPLDDLLYNHAFIGVEPVGGINSGSGVGAVKGFPVFKEITDAQNAIGEQTFYRSNAQRETEFFWKYGFRLDKGFQILRDISIYPYNVLAPRLSESGKAELTDCTYTIHHFQRSWEK